jgi:hypothetical protein
MGGAIMQERDNATRRASGKTLPLKINRKRGRTIIVRYICLDQM